MNKLWIYENLISKGTSLQKYCTERQYWIRTALHKRVWFARPKRHHLMCEAVLEFAYYHTSRPGPGLGRQEGVADGRKALEALVGLTMLQVLMKWWSQASRNASRGVSLDSGTEMSEQQLGKSRCHRVYQCDSCMIQIRSMSVSLQGVCASL